MAIIPLFSISGLALEAVVLDVLSLLLTVYLLASG